MTSNDILLVKKSWRLLRLIRPEVLADAFYSKLFFDHPELRAMFPEDMKEQYKKLIDMLSMMVLRLDHMEEYRVEIVELARRHEGYGVKPKHYAMVGAALLWTLEQGLGKDWDAETAGAWLAYYTWLTKEMTL